MSVKTPNSQVLSRFQRLFRGRENAFGQWVKDDVKTLERPVSEKEWITHLSGKGPILGIIPITQTNDCYFGAIDIDDEGINHAALAGIVEHAKLPLVVCRSKSGGAHLYLFLLEPVPAKLVQDKLKKWAQQLQLKNPPYPSGAAHPIEVFPKQTKTDPGATGNWINLPYFGNGTTDRYALTGDGEKLAVDDFLEYAETRAISQMTLEATEADIEGSFKGGPPCLKTLDIQGFPEGGRNDGLLAVGTYYKLRDKNETGVWKQELLDYNRSGKVIPPLKEKEILAITRSLDKRDFQYRCDQNPISAFCEKRQCKKEDFGISGFRKKRVAGSMPEMSDLRKVTTDPPRWILKVEGQDIELTTEDLMLVPRFRRAVLEKCSMVFPLLKQHEWDDELSKLLHDHTVIIAPQDAGVNGVFVFLLHEFLERRRNARNLEDILSGLPYQDQAKVWFRSTDLISFLDRKRFKDYDAPQIFMALRRLGAGHDKKNIKGAGIQLWFIEPPKDEQTEEFSDLKTEEPVF